MEDKPRFKRTMKNECPYCGNKDIGEGEPTGTDASARPPGVRTKKPSRRRRHICGKCKRPFIRVPK